MENGKKKSFVAILANVEMWIAMAALFAVVAMNLIEIVLRGALGHSFLWIQEFSVVMMLWMTFMGFVKIAYINKDVYIDYLVNKLPDKLHDVITIVATVLIIVFLVILSSFACRLWYQQRNVVTIVAKIPQIANTTPVVICFFSLIIVYLEKLKITLDDLRGRKEGEH